jgi:phage baseplate assembly protein gpV
MLGMSWMEVQMNRASAKMRLLPAITMILVCGIFGLALAKSGAAAGGAPVFSPDKGKLVIQLNGENIGSEQFELLQMGNNWLAKGTTELKVPGTTAATSVSGTLLLQPDGAPISYEWTSHADKTNGAHVVFSNGTAKITLQMQGARPFEQDLSFKAPVIAILDNNLYHQYALLAKLYDWAKRGTQTFPVLIPQDLTPGTISVEGTGSQTVSGKAYEGLRVTTADLEVLLMLDSNHRLMRLEVPSAKVSVIRQ